jgi:hypothetical protein
MNQTRRYQRGAFAITAIMLLLVIVATSMRFLLSAAESSNYVSVVYRQTLQALMAADSGAEIALAKLRKAAGLQIEVFLPQNTEQLLERFNQILSAISLDDARQPDNSTAPRRVLIAHDAKAINKRDLQLLARMYQRIMEQLVA